MTSPLSHSHVDDIAKLNVKDAAPAIASVVRYFEDLMIAHNELDKAIALVNLNEAIADLKSWHPQFNIENGLIEDYEPIV